METRPRTRRPHVRRNRCAAPLPTGGLSTNLALMLGALTLAVLAAELLARFGLGTPQWSSNYRYDAELGHIGPANATLQFGAVTVRYDAQGFRLIGPAAPRDADVLVLGDSVTEAVTVPDDALYVARLSALLTPDGDVPVRTAMLAVGDWGTTQALLAYRRHGRRPGPRLVMLQFFGLNDFTNNGIAFAERTRSRHDRFRPYPTPGAQPGTLAFTYLHPWRKRLRDTSVLAGWLEARFVTMGADPAPRAHDDCGDHPDTIPLTLFVDVPDARWQASFAATDLVVRALATDVREDGGRFLAVYVPSPWEMIDDHWRGFAAWLARCRPAQAADRWAAERAFRAVFDAAGIEHVSLRAPFAAALAKAADLYFPDGHLSVAGHDVAAVAIRAYVGAGASTHTESSHRKTTPSAP